MSNPAPTLDFTLRHDAWGRLVLIDAMGREHVGVEPVRDFPISDPKHWISLVSAEGKELACVEEPEKLPPDVRKVLEDDLARREFVPVIHTIERITSTDPTEWTVTTDRGPTKFVVKSDDDIRRLGRHRALVVDAYGIRYFIADTKKLDAPSRKLLERYL
jgi:hypothetical protein